MSKLVSFQYDLLQEYKCILLTMTQLFDFSCNLFDAVVRESIERIQQRVNVEP